MEYPKMVYHEDGRSQVIQEGEPVPAGFSDTPSEIHFAAPSNPENRAAVARVDQSGRDDMVERTARRVVELLKEEMGGSAPEQAERPRRGRPPNTIAQRAETRVSDTSNDHGDDDNG